MRTLARIALGALPTLVMIAIIACQGVPASEPAVSENQPNSVGGKIRFENIETAFANADVYVRLEDVSRADAPAITVAEQKLSNVSMAEGTGQTLEYTLSHPALETRNSYAMRIHVDVDRSGKQFTTGDYINTTRYAVAAPGATGPLDITVELIPDRGPGGATNASPNEPPAPGWVSAPAPIESVKVEVLDSAPFEYSLVVWSYLNKGSSCTKSDGFEVDLGRNTVNVTVTNLEVADRNTPCTADLPIVKTTIPLGTEFSPREAYSVVVNGTNYASFTALDPEGPRMALHLSPIEEVKIILREADPFDYEVKAISTLPSGSSCSLFNGYTVQQPASNAIEVSITHYAESEQALPCTADLPIVETTVPLEFDLRTGESYTVTVNGAEPKEFTVR